MNTNIYIKHDQEVLNTVHGTFHDHELLKSFEIYTDDNGIQCKVNEVV